MNRYKPRQLTSPVKAIREMCIECMGGRGAGQNYSKMIEDCSSLHCGLYNFRFGKNPFVKRPELSEERKLALQAGRNKKNGPFSNAGENVSASKSDNLM